MKVIVLGASHGGYEAVEALRSTYSDLEVQWYDKGDFDSIVGWDAKKATEKIEELERREIYVFGNTEITGIEPDKHRVKLLNHKTGKSREESYDKLILSPGANPFILPVPGNDLKNVRTMSDRPDIIDMRKHAAEPDIQNVVVIGAGYIGIGAADLFAAKGKKVTLVDHNDRPLSTYLDKEFTDVLEKELTDRDVELTMEDEVTRFVGDDNDNVTKVVTKRDTYPADLVVMSVGNRPNTAWLKGAVELLPNGKIKTDEYMRTSEPDIFAIGDATLVQYIPGKTSMSITLATNARRQARYAVRNLEGANHAFPGVQGSSASPFFDYKFATTGLTDKTAQRLGIEINSVYVEQETLMDYTAPANHKTSVMFKLVYEPKSLVILGAQIMSKDDWTANINTVSVAIQAHFTVEQLAYADFFFQPGLTTPWNVLNTAGLKALQQEDRA